jgi:hypothetical protein
MPPAKYERPNCGEKALLILVTYGRTIAHIPLILRNPTGNECAIPLSMFHAEATVNASRDPEMSIDGKSQQRQETTNPID